MRYFIIFFVLISCDSFFKDNIHKVDSDLEQYYQLFINEGIARGQDYSQINIILKFGDLDGNKLGTNRFRIDNVVEIIIDRDRWYEKVQWTNAYRRTRKEVNIFHELGHGILNRNHNNNCKSLMIKEEYCKYENYELFREQMIDELFR